MTARIYYDNDADPAALAGQTVAIIGYGSQGHAHALNLHESGIDVVVGLKPGSKSRSLAEDAGLRVAGVGEAVEAADVVMILVPDTEQKAVYDDYQAVNQTPGVTPGLGLDVPETATTVRVQDGKTLTTDGPFVEMKEALGGYLVFEADDLDAAIELASRIPAARLGGAIEIRPTVEW